MSAPLSIACCINFYNDALALRGSLETAAPFFDNIFCINSGPGGAYSTDGSIELCKQFGATVVFDDIQKGFGAIRTRLIHDCGCSWAFIMDADERFFPIMPVMHCEGQESYPEFAKPNLSTFKLSDVQNQGALVRRLMLRPELMAIRTSRRHWFDFSLRHPTQNWKRNRDHQLRIVRNVPEIGYEKDRVMHERLVDSRTGKDPLYHEQDDISGPFHDHFHMFFRRSQPGKKEGNEQNYARLERREKMLILP